MSGHVTNPTSNGSSSIDPLTKHKLMGLESIIETLDSPSIRHSNSGYNKLNRPHSIAVGHADSPREHKSSVTSTSSSEYTPKLQIKAETLAVINEFEAMTRELLKPHK